MYFNIDHKRANVNDKEIAQDAVITTQKKNFRVLLIQYKTPDKIRIFVLPAKSFSSSTLQDSIKEHRVMRLPPRDWTLAKQSRKDSMV